MGSFGNFVFFTVKRNLFNDNTFQPCLFAYSTKLGSFGNFMFLAFNYLASIRTKNLTDALTLSTCFIGVEF